MRVLVTDATGYLGGRLIPALLDAGAQVRCLAHDPAALDRAPWRAAVTVTQGYRGGDARSGDDRGWGAARDALAGVDVAYYLTDSIEHDAPDAADDDTSARAFAAAAQDVGVQRIVCLGDLVGDRADRVGRAGRAGRAGTTSRSTHATTAEALAAGGVPTIVLRMTTVLCAGSPAFETLRYLTERQPVMLAPAWLRTRIQPVAAADVLHYLVAVTRLPTGASQSFDIGGPEVLTYRELIDRYGRAAGLPRRHVVEVPARAPELSSRWIGFVTPIPAAVAQSLVDALTTDRVCHDHDLAERVGPPPGGPTGVDTALRHALRGEPALYGEEPALPGEDAAARPAMTGPSWAGGARHVESRRAALTAEPERVWRVITELGTADGYRWPPMWGARGAVDRLFGGPGAVHGRDDAATLRPGDAVDFWRVDAVEPGRALLLSSTLRAPGKVMLELRLERGDRPVLLLRLTFVPHGLAGELYWHMARYAYEPLFDDLLDYLASAGASRAWS